ncbi:hypothetical protein BOCO_1058 [Bombiscardovia coagulans]|uniref:Uncharacterized protein n=1 Tax=Bombiscardovia coagulans TaxID=686666 RepID=A0A261EQW5_9BIFI|nr:hypothetical protein BOCO_1058 [Bombiscardovia coagulans]
MGAAKCLWVLGGLAYEGRGDMPGPEGWRSASLGIGIELHSGSRPGGGKRTGKVWCNGHTRVCDRNEDRMFLALTDSCPPPARPGRAGHGSSSGPQPLECVVRAAAQRPPGRRYPPTPEGRTMQANSTARYVHNLTNQRNLVIFERQSCKKNNVTLHTLLKHCDTKP